MGTANYVIHLDGVNQHWTIADDASLDYATSNAFTFGLWFWLDSDYTKTGRTYLWSRQNQHEMYIESGELIYYFNGAGGAVTWRTGIKVVPQHVYFLCLTGTESTDTTLKLYVDGELKETEEVTGGMPNDTNTSLYFGIDYGTTSGQYFKGNMTGFFQSNDTAVALSDVVTMWNSGVYDIDTTEGITGLDDSIGFEEDTGTAYDNALNEGLDGAGQNTPVWVDYMDLGMKAHDRILVLGSIVEQWDGRLCIKSIEWKGEDIADGDELVLTNYAGKTVFHTWAKADDTGESKDFDPVEVWNGVKMPTCGHGLVFLYLG